MAVQMRTMLAVADNSGARKLQVILPLGGGRKRVGGDRRRCIAGCAGAGQRRDLGIVIGNKEHAERQAAAAPCVVTGRIDDAVQAAVSILELKYRIDLLGVGALEADDRTLCVGGLGRRALVVAVEHHSGEDEYRGQRER